jgi:ATP-dependent protease ClpP protease subunit
MNRRRKDILASLESVTAFALGPNANIIGNIYGATSPLTHHEKRDVPGLAMNVLASGSAELMIYGPIGGSIWDMGITAVDVAHLLREAGDRPIAMRINSPGGDVFQGVAIHTLLARHPGTVTGSIDGLAASAASVVMLAADNLDMAKAGFVMIHDAMTPTYGNADTHRTSADLLDKVSASMAEMYADKAGEDADHWRALMTVNREDGTWYTAAEALDAGLVDSVTQAPEDAEDTAYARLSAWSNVLPDKIRADVLAHAPELDTEEDSEPAVRWDAAQFATLMKEAMA